MEVQHTRHPAVLALAGLLSLAVGIGIGRFAYLMGLRQDANRRVSSAATVRFVAT